MEGGDSLVRRWEDLDSDILVKIFQSFDLLELTGPAQVFTAWLLACSDQVFWKMLDLSVLKSNFIKIPFEPYIYVDSQSDKSLTCLLKIYLNLSRGSILTLIFHYNLYVRDDQLTYTAERCPRLKHLVMPAWNRIEETGICRAIRMWEDLESLTMPSIEDPPCVMTEIGRSCKNFAELKIMGPCDLLFASTLVEYLPNLKVLSVRCTVLSKPALVIILEGLKKLEVLNISHCLITEVPPPEPMEILTELDESILEKASRLREFLTCMSDSCIMCQHTRNDEGLLRWYRYEEDLWKVDEVKSLAI
ncbi:F-box/LRR-repeat protein At3g48880-like [Lycium barbarum]|uniref:F-box/LRR-repeat protein At3g48880-like n=1 Tax=Lycium barbarum TaxID=112863 RepID=UPI00293E793B|nr:F-box/LRR-repeat protein At3g48880-like [Lycium barbarum]XP_060203580.1 F-box/LRR-repeat protein At3g48880-like [Lycium barbarum]XP_060203582.1 F-box/LRR-repeat protein At3g48880-like [Lycium barbarum]XP_060203583.1 F-box/LRR-repeat protein At3g48880-like [Lycium barbarum]XP_060203584.1 F-box/LRR-repeat protein At3g48880-like [Lycium barbarum]